MNTRLLMIASSVFQGAAGLALTFAPQEVASTLMTGGSASLLAPFVASPLPLVLQVMGALYVAFALLNWNARFNLIGGIYGRPVAMANFTHCAIAALALLKNLQADRQPALVAAAVIYAGFAVAFGVVVFGRPPLPGST